MNPRHCILAQVYLFSPDCYHTLAGWLPPSLLPSLLPPSQPRVSSPPPLPSSSGSSSSRFSGSGDGQRARAAQQLGIRRPRRPQLPAPPPLLPPPPCARDPVALLGPRRRRLPALHAARAAQPSRAPAWRSPLRTGESLGKLRGSGSKAGSRENSSWLSRVPPNHWL